jgi:hypothetical protein
MREIIKLQNKNFKALSKNQWGHIGKKLSFHPGMLIIFLLLLNFSGIAGSKKPVADGSFVQAQLCGSWDDARWQQEFAVMKETGMHYLIIGAVAESQDGGKAATLYPSSLPNTSLNFYLNGNDMVDICLRNAEAAGIKVFIGIGMNEKWWQAPGVDSTWLYNQMEFDNKVCDEVWAKYKNKYPSAFYGWYWVYEVANVSLTTVQQDVLVRAMNMQLDHLKSKNEKLPFMWCPFMRSEFGSPEAYKEMWIHVLAGIHTNDGDIFAPQDCVGAGGLKLDEVAKWFAALRQAADTKPGLKFWSDVETFDHVDWLPATVGRFVSQMELEQPYVENFITFAYSHYDSPYNTNPGFHKTYMGYLKDGAIEAISPSVPQNFKAVINSDGSVKLKWDASTDNIGVCGYYIYRNGAMIARRQERMINDDWSKQTGLTGYTDRGINPDSVYSYSVKAFDFAGNVSDLAVPITVNIPPHDANVKEGQ